MKRGRWMLITAVACLALGQAGCFDGDDGDDRARQRAREYSAAVERISDDVYRDGGTALTTLNRLADGSLAARLGASQLDRLAGRLKIAVTRLRRLRPPEPARASDYDLERAVASYSLDLRFAATDVRVAAREQADLGTIARGQAGTVRVQQSGVSALSRALRRLAFQAE